MLAQGLERDHKIVRDLIEKYKSDFEDFSVLKKRKLRSTGGRSANEYMMDEDQFMFLGTLLRNTKKVVAFKKAIVQQFKKCRKANEALQHHKQQPEYQITRDAGKIVRRQTTDVMQEFVEYAKSQGSKNADKYYSNITRMLNGLLFIVEGKYKNLRNVMKEIYKDVRGKVELFAELHGKSEIISKQLSIP